MLQPGGIIFFQWFCNIQDNCESYGIMTDKELVERVLEGNEHACRFLVASYQKLVNHIVRRMVLQDAVAEDLCQDVFLRIFRQLRTFRGEARLSTWIATVAYNTTATYLKKRKLMNEQALESCHLATLREEGGTVADRMDAGEIKQLLLESIERLPVHYRTVLTLFYLDEFSCQEIAQITAMPDGTVRNYLHRSRMLLKSQLEKMLDHEERTVLSR